MRKCAERYNKRKRAAEGKPAGVSYSTGFDAARERGEVEIVRGE